MALKFYFPLFALLMAAFIGCSKSSGQQEFENEAFTHPEGYTEVNASGEVIRTDPDDWRISPTYRGLVSIGTPSDQPPYPNPLHYNQYLTLNIYLRSIETLSTIEIYVFEFPSQLNGPIAVRTDLSPPTLEAFTLSGATISGSAGGTEASGLYRLLIYDGRQTLISYGDIRIP